MSKSAASIVAEALSLSPQARAYVAEVLLESLDAAPGGELSPAWRDEIRKRCQEMDQGEVEFRDAADVFAEAYTALS